MKNQKGITLVALVVTIIVLLILAGVSISLVVGQNGVLTQAQDAVLKNQAAEVREKVSMALGAAEMKYTSEWAMNQAVTREEIFNESGPTTTLTHQKVFKDELAKDSVYVRTATTMKPTVTDGKPGDLSTDVNPVDATDPFNFYYNGNTYQFTVVVDKTKGTVTLGNEVKVFDAEGKQKPNDTTTIKFN